MKQDAWSVSSPIPRRLLQVPRRRGVRIEGRGELVFRLEAIRDICCIGLAYSYDCLVLPSSGIGALKGSGRQLLSVSVGGTKPLWRRLAQLSSWIPLNTFVYH